MPKIATKTQNNIFYLARKSALRINLEFGSRDGAAAVSGINKTRLFQIESGKAAPHLDEVNHLSVIYQNPGLKRNFCTTMCPLRQGSVFDTQTGARLAECARNLKEGCEAMNAWIQENMPEVYGQCA